MPFTPSHVAAVLPLARAPLDASALVIGSMAPDVPYYAPGLVGADVTHSPLGVVGVDVLLGLAGVVLWHGLLARPALACAPPGVRGRVGGGAVAGVRTRLGSLPRAALVVASLVLGSATHVAWDAFTHAGRWGTGVVPWLAQVHGPLPGYVWAQHASTVVGAGVVVAWLAAWWRHTPDTRDAAGLPPAVAAGAWTAVLLTGTVVAVIRGTGPLLGGGAPDLTSAAFRAATAGGAGAALVAVAVAVALRPLVPEPTDDAHDSARR